MRCGGKMPKQKISREYILKGAAAFVAENGAEALNARSLAHALGCSTQPIYSAFENMNGLKRALLEEAKKAYRGFIDAYLDNAPSRYEAFGLGYVRFAREEKGLFRFLYLRAREEDSPRNVDDPFIEDIIAEMKSLYGMDETRARAFHGDMAVYSYGLATLVCTDYTAYSDEDIDKMLKREFYALYAYYFPERPPLGVFQK